MSEFCMPSLGADMDSAILMEWKVIPNHDNNPVKLKRLRKGVD